MNIEIYPGRTRTILLFASCTPTLTPPRVGTHGARRTLRLRGSCSPDDTVSAIGMMRQSREALSFSVSANHKGSVRLCGDLSPRGELESAALKLADRLASRCDEASRTCVTGLRKAHFTPVEQLYLNDADSFSPSHTVRNALPHRLLLALPHSP